MKKIRATIIAALILQSGILLSMNPHQELIHEITQNIIDNISAKSDKFFDVSQLTKLVRSMPAEDLTEKQQLLCAVLNKTTSILKIKTLKLPEVDNLVTNLGKTVPGLNHQIISTLKQLIDDQTTLAKLPLQKTKSFLGALTTIFTQILRKSIQFSKENLATQNIKSASLLSILTGRSFYEYPASTMSMKHYEQKIEKQKQIIMQLTNAAAIITSVSQLWKPANPEHIVDAMKKIYTMVDNASFDYQEGCSVYAKYYDSDLTNNLFITKLKEKSQKEIERVKKFEPTGISNSVKTILGRNINFCEQLAHVSSLLCNKNNMVCFVILDKIKDDVKNNKNLIYDTKFSNPLAGTSDYRDRYFEHLYNIQEKFEKTIRKIRVKILDKILNELISIITQQ